jgi:2-polyprenyl-6-methoxyphenol hydroxylase-like FAD-dependent oxidoreductase
MRPTPVLISGGGIAGLTLAILLKKAGYQPLVVEHEPALRAEGYMMDFFGTGWDVAERMGLVPDLRALRYPIDQMEFVEADGRAYFSFPISRVRNALDDRYVYLRRPDLERILYERARAADVGVRFGTSVRAIDEGADDVHVTFEDGSESCFALAFGADGQHSRIRELCFGPEGQLDKFLDGYVAAFHVEGRDYGIDRAFRWYEEPDRVSMFYPLAKNSIDTTFVFRSENLGRVAPENRIALIERTFGGMGYIAPRVIVDAPARAPVYFDSLTQIVMPQWHAGRVALLGDACGCLTLLAGQGSHMAMAGAFVLARELKRYGRDHRAAFAAYESFLRPHVERKQRDAARFRDFFVPKKSSHPWLRRLFQRAIFSPLSIKYLWRTMGSVSVLKDYR